jgi:hypothetical protein
MLRREKGVVDKELDATRIDSELSGRVEETVRRAVARCASAICSSSGVQLTPGGAALLNAICDDEIKSLTDWEEARLVRLHERRLHIHAMLDERFHATIGVSVN